MTNSEGEKKAEVLKREQFPGGFKGVIGANGEPISFERPNPSPVPPPHIHVRGVHLYRIELPIYMGSFDIWADHKGRGFWVVDLKTHMDISGPIHADWRSIDQVLAALAAVISTRDQILKSLKGEYPMVPGKECCAPEVRCFEHPLTGEYAWIRTRES